jgi:hypothetical protein
MLIWLLGVIVNTSLASRVDEFNVTVTQDGLMIPFRISQDVNQTVNFELTSQHHFSSLSIDRLLRYPFFEDSDDDYDSVLGNEISISLNSPIAQHYMHAILIPSRDEGFKLVLGSAEPSEYCHGPMVSAQLRYPLSFHTRVFLIASPNRPITPNVAATVFSRTELTTIDTLRQKDGLIPEVYDALVEELESLVGGERERFDLLPSIQYTIYRNGYDFEPIAHIVLSPEDYLSRQPDGQYELQVVRTEGVRHSAPVLGINFLRNVGVYLNYAENEIGFCDPL